MLESRLSQIPSSLEGSSSKRVDGLLFRVRWALLLLVIPITWIDSGGKALPALLWNWLAIVAFFNLILGIVLRFFKKLPDWLPTATLILDAFLFGLLPHLVASGSNFFTFFAMFPAVVGAVRFGPQIGLVLAGLLGLPVEVRAFLPILDKRDVGELSAGLPIAALLAATALIGYISQREKEAVLGKAAVELEELRRAMEGAKLLYSSTDALSTTTSYAPVLETMLEAGVNGLPSSRMEDGQPVGMALFFDDHELERSLYVAASRHLSRRDMALRIVGKQGIVGETLRSGSFVVFDRVTEDPELSVFSELRRCNSGVCYPLQAGLEQYGVVILAGTSPRRPSPQHLELMRAFTNQAATAFRYAKLYESLRAEHDQTIRSENEMRQKLVRDLHDGPTQKVSNLVMQMEHISRLLGKNTIEARRELENARGVAEQAVRELRTALVALRPLALETKGLSAALKQYCNRLSENENVSISVEPGDFGTELDPNIAATVFTIIEEAVNNARKHARGTPILVRASRNSDSLVATIQDRGKGFDLEEVNQSYGEHASMGLQNMRERSKLINGDLHIDTAPGLGTRVTLIVPLPKTVSKALPV